MSTRKSHAPRPPGGLLCATLIAVACAGCRQAAKNDTEPEKPTKAGEHAMKLTIQSPAFGNGETVPKKHTGDGPDLSPPLQWSGVPTEAKKLALICDDPDAPRPEPWVHWVIYDIPPTLTNLPEGLPARATLTEPAGVQQGLNSWGTIGYRGPAPPRGGPHHYHFKLYALDAAPELLPSLAKDDLLKRIKPHIIAEADLVGTYQR